MNNIRFLTLLTYLIFALGKWYDCRAKITIDGSEIQEKLGKSRNGKSEMDERNIHEWLERSSSILLKTCQGDE